MNPRTVNKSNKVTFDVALVRRLLEDSKNATSWRATLSQGAGAAEPGLWLVADRGIYLMSNSIDGVMAEDSTEDNRKHLVAYARECNPDKSDDWYSAKRRIFGGDDAVEFLDVSIIEAAMLRSKGKSMSFYIWPHKISANPA